MRFNPTDVGWRIGRSKLPRGVELWQPWDRTAGVIGPQGSGKTLDILTPALLQAPGAALVTLTKPVDLLLTFTARSTRDRPCLVLDPFNASPGLPRLVWDPIAGCVDAAVAERRAKAFCAGTIAKSGSVNDSAAQFYAGEAAKVIQCYLHAAALTGGTLDDVLGWVANPRNATLPSEVLLNHPHAEPNWHGLLAGAIHNADDRTSGNTKTTVEQALALFTIRDRRERCIPGPGRPATDLAALIRRGGTLYLLGREDPYVSASPLMTAVAEDFLDTALRLANTSRHGRLCPPLLACLDELPSTAPLPTLATRMANERAMGISILWASQTRSQLEQVYGPQARSILGLSNTLVVFGGSKDQPFNKELSELLGTRRITRRNHQHGPHTSSSSHGEDIPVIRPEQIRELHTGAALIVAENGKPIIATLTRSIDGKRGRQLLQQQTQLRTHVQPHTGPATRSVERAAAAVAISRELGLTTD
ncbi:TraM recognition domain-containing protein [Tessaracoccus sp. OS52]|uniref:type IV secretory system conjugative DNA transfer family protein n=1 Tax=Tessaracoccus sp. OS52 TaxID=2886691 RepID=UPI001D130636|nr:TraM recognition domain-containing protein [Tessaracoccus sp. OS52]MCC2592545.1 TraM recognition domain-containing protein [Tessaracoccus sp. OS52]